MTARAQTRKARPAADEPAYTIGDGARLLHIPVSTLKFWVKGGTYQTKTGMASSPAIIRMADPVYLSFRNLAEAYVLRGLRRQRQMTLPDLRGIVKFLEKELNDRHPLAHPDLRAHGGYLVFERSGELISASEPGQLLMREAFEAHIERLIWHDGKVAQLFPFASDHTGPVSRLEPKIVLIDPTIAYGQPTIAHGVRTRMISERFDAGDSIATLCEDYDAPVAEVEEALRYERVGAKYEEAA